MWNIDWFKARRFAYSGVPVRRASWEDKWFVYRRGFLWVMGAGYSRIAVATDLSESDLIAGDYTTLPPSLQCDALVRAPAAVPEAPYWAGEETWGDNIITPPPAPFFIA